MPTDEPAEIKLSVHLPDWPNPLNSVINLDMTVPNKIIALARWVRSQLASGLLLPDSVHNYMDATFGTTDLDTIIGADASGEVDSLLDLIFFPDMDIQIRYETQWGDQNLTATDLAAIQTRLCQTPLTVAIFQSPGTTPISIRVPNFVLKAFVQRLNITWQPAAQLTKTLAQQWQGMAALQLRVHLRNARLVWHADQINMINQYLTKVPPNIEDAETGIIFLLALLPEYTPQRDPYKFLVAKKFFYFQSLCKAEDFERKRLASNMETMMLQGNLSAHGSVAQWRQQMQSIDSICQTIFGRTHFFQQPNEHCLDLQSGSNTQMMDDVIRSLS